MSQVVISIIVPVCNRGYCLKRCLDSVKEQSFPDWECLLIDDGSTDDTYEICKEYAMNDDRFRAYHQKNQGVSAARNKGLDMVEGIYVSFVDSDDYLEKDCLKKLYEAVGDNDLVVGGIRSFKEGQLFCEYIYKDITLFPKLDYEKEFVEIESLGMFYGPCCKLYKYSIIKEHQICFPIHMSFSEDTVFNYTYLLYVSSFRMLKDCLYIVIVTPGSLSDYFTWRPFDWIHASLYSQIKFYTEKELYGNLICVWLKTYYSSALWTNLNQVVYMHDILSVSERFALIKDSLMRVDYKQMGGTYSAWKGFVMKHSVIAWIFLELKYMLLRLHILKRLGDLNRGRT